MEFGKFLRAKRLKHGLLVSNFGITYSAISYIESGRNDPTFRSLVKIAEAFKMPTWKLLKEYETQKE